MATLDDYTYTITEEHADGEIIFIGKIDELNIITFEESYDEVKEKLEKMVEKMNKWYSVWEENEPMKGVDK